MPQSEGGIIGLDAFQGRQGLRAVSKVLINHAIKGGKRCIVLAGARHELINDGHVIVRNVEVAVLNTRFLAGCWLG